MIVISGIMPWVITQRSILEGASGMGNSNINQPTSTIVLPEWKSAVANIASLRGIINNNVIGDVRLVIDEGKFYEWIGASWKVCDELNIYGDLLGGTVDLYLHEVKAGSFIKPDGTSVSYAGHGHTDLSNAIATKASTNDVDIALALKADDTTVITALGLKANIVDVVAALSLKADKTTVDADLLLKANVTDVTASLALKADASAVYTKVETDDIIETVIGAAPAVLDTLIELSAALGDDADYAATMITILATKVNTESGKGLSANDFTNDEKSKLTNVAENANNYSHPVAHDPSIITTDATHQFMTNDEKVAITAAATKVELTDGLALKVSTVAGKGLSANDYTDTEKTKLAGIAESANNYSHPATHDATEITQDATHRFVTDVEKTAIAGAATQLALDTISLTPGPQGIKGDTGAKGDKGDTGLQGIPGDAGAKGDNGANGVKGDTGAQGEIGPQGTPGIDGSDGDATVYTPTDLTKWAVPVPTTVQDALDRIAATLGLTTPI